jgi:hypothetical protein
MTALVAAVLLSVVATFSSPAFAQERTERGDPNVAATQATRAPAKVTPTHYKIDVAFEPERHFLRATAAVTLRVAEKTEAIEFELNRHLTLQSVTDEQGRALEFTRSRRLGSHKLLVRLAEPALVDSTITLTFTYEGALPPGQLDYITPDGILLRDESRWYPATDLAAFTTHETVVSIPSPWELVVSGSPVDSIAAGISTVHRWRSDYPVSSRSLFAAQALNCPDKESFSYWKGNLLTASVCGGVDQRHTWQRQVVEQMDFISKFAWDRDDRKNLVVVPGFSAQAGVIGYSAPGLLVVSEDVVKWHGYPGFAPEFLPHEIAHQWFPIEVTLRSEEDGWLAESLAEYLAWRYLEEKQPDDARRMVARAMRSTLAHQPLRPLRLGLKLFALEDWDVTHAALYQRGMLVWRTLETVIDRKRVDAALREYYRRHRGGPASIADFRPICEEISERDLAWFFDYYINGAALPEITLRRLPAAAPGELAGEILIRNAPPEFQVRVGMRITTTGGVIEHSVAARGEVTPFAIEVRDPVTAVELDPDLRVLRVTEAARRHRAQHARLEQTTAEGPESSGEELSAILAELQATLELDPEDLAANHQFLHLQVGRLQLRRKEYHAAWQTLNRVLALESLDPMATDLHRAWARVYRARIARARGDRATARREAEAGLAMKCPALETRVAWPLAENETTAAQELQRLLSKLPRR